MAHTFAECSHYDKAANPIDFVVLNQRLLGSIQDTRAYRSTVIDVKSKDHCLVGFMANSQLKLRKNNYISGRYALVNFMMII